MRLGVRLDVRLGVRLGVKLGVRVGVRVGVRLGVRVGVRVCVGLGGDVLAQCLLSSVQNERISAFLGAVNDLCSLSCHLLFSPRLSSY